MRRDLFYTEGPYPGDLIGYPYGHMGASHYGGATCMPMTHRFYYDDPAPSPEPAEAKPEIVLPDRVKEKLARDRAQEQENAFALARERQRAIEAQRPRKLTDAECEERYGTDFAGLVGSVRYWERRLHRLHWWQRRERLDAELSLREARSRRDEAIAERVVGDVPATGESPRLDNDVLEQP